MMSPKPTKFLPPCCTNMKLWKLQYFVPCIGLIALQSLDFHPKIERFVCVCKSIGIIMDIQLRRIQWQNFVEEQNCSAIDSISISPVIPPWALWQLCNMLIYMHIYNPSRGGGGSRGDEEGEEMHWVTPCKGIATERRRGRAHSGVVPYYSLTNSQFRSTRIISPVALPAGAQEGEKEEDVGGGWRWRGSFLQ